MAEEFRRRWGNDWSPDEMFGFQRDIETAFTRANQRGTWTPAITFVTPGDLSVTYTTQWGEWERQGRFLTVYGAITTSGFTHTTASGELRITGIPEDATTDTGSVWVGDVIFQGVTKAGYSDFALQIAAATNTQIRMIASNSGSAFSAVAAADMPTGGSVVLRFQLRYRV